MLQIVIADKETSRGILDEHYTTMSIVTCSTQFVTTLSDIGMSSLVAYESSTACGLSLTGVTVMKISAVDDLPLPSDIVYDMESSP